MELLICKTNKEKVMYGKKSKKMPVQQKLQMRPQRKMGPKKSGK